MTEREPNLAGRSSPVASSYALAAGIGAAIFVIFFVMLFALSGVLEGGARQIVWMVFMPIGECITWIGEAFLGEGVFDKNDIQAWTLAVIILAVSGAIVGVLVNTIALLVRRTREDR